MYGYYSPEEYPYRYDEHDEHDEWSAFLADNPWFESEPWWIGTDDDWEDLLNQAEGR